ncbi:MAG: response regulator [Algicola sp.]|nr:response regulator [Algicola sp.]
MDTPCKGSVFHFTVLVERLGESSALQATQQCTSLAPDLTGYNILLVDDNAINLQVALGFLADTGANVVTQNDGAQALQQLRTSRFDLVLIDIEMPIMDGITATKAIRSELKLTELPIIAMTAHAMTKDNKQYQRAGMNDCLIKPFEPATLYKLLNEYLAQNGRPRQIQVMAESQSPYRSELIEQLEQVDGLDALKALSRMNDKTELYIKLVKEFKLVDRALLQSLNELYDQQLWDDLYRNVHSLKSNAAFIGAYQIAKLSGAVEFSLSEGKSVAKSDRALLDELCEALEQLLDRLDNILPEHRASEHQTAFDPQQFRQKLKVLLPLLDSTNFDAEDLLGEMIVQYEDTEYVDAVKSMIADVDDLEFEAAGETAEGLLAKMSG